MAKAKSGGFKRRGQGNVAAIIAKRTGKPGKGETDGIPEPDADDLQRFKSKGKKK